MYAFTTMDYQNDLRSYVKFAMFLDTVKPAAAIICASLPMTHRNLTKIWEIFWKQFRKLLWWLPPQLPDILDVSLPEEIQLYS